MSPHCPTTAPRNPIPPQNSTPNRSTQRPPTNFHTRPSQMQMWDFVTRNPLPATPITAEVNPTPEQELSQEIVNTTGFGNILPEQQPEPLLPPPPLQRAIQHDPSNEPWGDYAHYNIPHNHFRILSKNVSTLNSQNLDMLAIATELKNCDASAFLAQEMNIPWTPTSLQSIRSQCQQVHRHLKMATSSSTDSARGHYQPGRTLTVALGKWASRVIQWGSDEPLGRWSFLELVGQHGMRLMVVSAYQVCPQQFDATTSTVTAQQTCILLQQGVKHPNPHKQFIPDLTAQINLWCQQNKEVLVGLDANERIDDPHSKIMCLMAETDLIDLHHHHYPSSDKPTTHQCGLHPIDLILGSPHLASTLVHAWILPFGNPPLIKGDHHLLGLDLMQKSFLAASRINPLPVFCKASIVGMKNMSTSLALESCNNAIVKTLLNAQLHFLTKIP